MEFLWSFRNWSSKVIEGAAHRAYLCNTVPESSTYNFKCYHNSCEVGFRLSLACNWWIVPKFCLFELPLTAVQLNIPALYRGAAYLHVLSMFILIILVDWGWEINEQLKMSCGVPSNLLPDSCKSSTTASRWGKARYVFFNGGSFCSGCLVSSMSWTKLHACACASRNSL